MSANKTKKKTYYHTTGTRLRVGDVIGGPGKRVFMSDRAVTHRTIHEIVHGGFKSWTDFTTVAGPARQEYWDKRMEWNHTDGSVPKPEYPTHIVSDKPVNLTVYEVEPFKKPTWIGMNKEYVAYGDWVTVKRVVGNAKGILDNFTKKVGKNKSVVFAGATK